MKTTGKLSSRSVCNFHPIYSKWMVKLFRAISPDQYVIPFKYIIHYTYSNTDRYFYIDWILWLSQSATFTLPTLSVESDINVIRLVELSIARVCEV